jgi:GT2 family glycosyltransferase
LSKPAPLVSIVILNYNGQKYLLNCVDSVLKNQYPNFEVILIDNASTDNSIQPVEDTYKTDSRMHIIKNSTNLGFSGGNNVGFENSKGKYVVFLNNDTKVELDWLSSLVNALEADPTIGIAQSLIYQIDEKSIQSAGWLFSDYLIKKYSLCAGKPSNLQFKPVFDVSFACGASMIIRREILDKMGAFDPEAPYFYDDTLLSLKTRFLGKRVVTVSDSKMYHVSGATNVWKIRFTTYNLFKANSILIFDVYNKKADLAKAVVVNIFYVIGNVYFNILKSNMTAVLGNVEAFIWTLRNFPFIWRNRLLHWSKTEVDPEQVKKEFVRVNLPAVFYLFPSKISTDHLIYALDAYERTIKK